MVTTESLTGDRETPKVTIGVFPALPGQHALVTLRLRNDDTLVTWYLRDVSQITELITALGTALPKVAEVAA